MLKKVYLAECSSTYRSLLKGLLKPYTEEIVDLWENPSYPIEEQSQSLAIVDEDYLAKGPGPARSSLMQLFMEGRITQIPLILLERREKKISFRISPRAHRLRRPFYFQSLENIFRQLGIYAEFPEITSSIEAEIASQENEVLMSDNPLPPIEENISEKIEQAIAEAIQQANLSAKAQEVLEKTIRELVPSLAEKMIKEEIERLTK